jgi:Mrp family chromosome partitioning ATPase/capsular polysaccharide biosynthesis protein
MPPSSSQQVASEAPGVVLSLLRYWRSSVLVVLVSAALGFGVSLLLPKQYEARAQIGLTDPRGSNIFTQGGGALPQDLERYTARQRSLVRSGRTFERTRQQLDHDISVDELFNRVSVTSDVDGVLDIHGRGRTGKEAQDLANTVAAAYGSSSRDNVQEEVSRSVAAIEAARTAAIEDYRTAQERQSADPRNPVLQQQVRSTVDRLDALNQRISEIQVNGAAFDDGIEYFLAARRPKHPTEPQPLRNAAVAGLLGLILAGVISWTRADRHRAADEEGMPEQVLGIPMLGAVPELQPAGDLAALNELESPAAEAYQFAAASLQYLLRDGVVLVTSAGRGDGKTVSAASLAAVAARDGSRVILVDGDARSHGLTRRLLGPTDERAPGLVDIANGSAQWDEVVRALALPDGVLLPFLPAGGDAATLASLFRTQRMAEAVARLRESYELVVVDCSALLAVADVASLAAHADAIVLVVSRGTPLRSLEAVTQRLELVPAPLIGYVFTRAVAEDVTASYGSHLRLPWHVVPSGRRARERRRNGASASPVAGVPQGNGSDGGRSRTRLRRPGSTDG